MDSESVEIVKMAQQLYSLSIKFEKRIPKALITFSMQVCDRYTKIAKEEKISLNSDELIKYILK